MRRLMICLALLGALAATAAPASASSEGTLDATHGLRAASARLPTGLLHTAVPMVETAMAPNTTAGTPTTLSRLQSMVVDSATHHVFVTGYDDSDSTTKLIAFNFSGAAVTIPDETGAHGIALDGTNLYVARCVDQVIDVIDTTTLTRVDSIPIDATATGVPNSTDYCALGIAGGKLWYTPSDQWTELTGITIAAPHTATTYSGFGQFYAPQFITEANHPNLLIVTGSISGDTMIFDVSSGDPVQTGTLAGQAFDQGVVTPDAASILYGTSGGVNQWSLAADELQHQYPVATGDSFMPAVSSDGSYVAVSSDQYPVYTDPANVSVFAAGGTTPVQDFRLPEASTLLQTRIGFSADTSRIFVVTARPGDGIGAFHVLYGPTTKAPTLGISAPRGIKYGSTAKVTATLTGGKTNKSVAIWAQGYGASTGKLIAHGKVNSKGQFSTKVAPKKNTTFWATYNGDVTWQPAMSKARHTLVHVLVKGKLTGSYGTSGKYHLFHPTGLAKYTATVTPVHRGACITFVLEIHTSSGWKYVTACFAQNRKGQAHAYLTNLRIGKHYRVGAAFTDPAHAPGGTPWTYVEVTH